jgi:hypothetical protein
LSTVTGAATRFRGFTQRSSIGIVDSAWIAIIGTLSGVAITAITSILAVIVAARHQRLAADRQTAINTTERVRKELREAFVEYLAAYSDLRDKIVLLEKHSCILRNRSEDAPTIEEYAPLEAARFSRSYHTLRITASSETGEAANRATSQLWEVSRAAQNGDFEDFVNKYSSSRPLRRDLRAAMRKELGVD